MNVKYTHILPNDICRSGTIAVTMPLKQVVINSVTDWGKFLFLKLGYSLLQEGDRFKKKTGREIALKKMRIETAKLLNISFNEKRDVYHYEIGSFSRVSTKKIFFGLSVSPTSENVHLEYAYFE